MMIIKLKKQEEEINELIETWEEYQNAPEHFNVPLPDEILTDDCKFYNDRVKRDIDDFKLELEYLKEISKIYNENDFIVTEQYHMGNFNDTKEIKKVQITPELRKEIEKYCKRKLNP